jgi:hypothetical protein
VTQEQLTAEQEKNVILENKIRELQEQVKEGNLPPPIVYDKGS